MDESKKIKIIIIGLGVIIIMLIVQNYNFGKKYKSLERQLSSLQTHFDDTSNQMYKSFTGYVDSSLKRSQSLVETYSITYDGIDVENKTVNVHMSFRLKETSPDTEIQIWALPMNTPASKDTGFKAVTSNGVDYTSDFSLSYLDDYNFDIYETDGKGYNKKLNSEAMAKHIKSDFDHRTTNPSSGAGVDNKGIQIDFQLENKTFGQEEFKVKTVELVLLLDEKEVYRKDVTDRNVTNAEDIERINLMIASGQVDPEEGSGYDKIFGEMQMDSDGIEHGNYFVYLTHEEILGKTVDDNFPPQYNYHVEVTYVNGETCKVR